MFGQVRFDRTTGYSAVFSSASGLRPGQFVRASGVEVGKVEDVTLIEGGSKVKVDFNVDRSLPLFDESRASIRYLNLIGDRYLDLSRGDSNTKLAAGATIHTGGGAEEPTVLSGVPIGSSRRRVTIGASVGTTGMIGSATSPRA